MNRTLEHILPNVQKPARYTGGEYNAVVKDKKQIKTRFALCFPDTYEIGMSNLGCRILYGVMNRRSDVWCERCYAPWGDMEEEMRREGLLLYGLESGDAIADFDIIGFSLGYEMAYTNVLNMLDLAGVPLRAADRPDLAPMIVAGGTCCYNPEPLAPFIDLFILGEGEEVTLEYIDLYQQANEEGWSKEEFLQEAAKIPGIYVPSLYEVTYRPDGVVEAVNVTQNNFAASGQVAFVISNGNNKTVTFYVTDSVRQTLTPGQAVTVTYNGQSYEGAVTEIGGVVDAQVGQFRVKAIIDGAQDLPDGLAVELTTTAHQVTGAVLIPSDAMFFESGVSYVYVVQDGKAVRSDVTIGLYTADTIAVTSGLTLGDEVITTWSSSLRDGVSVQTAAQAEDSESAQADPAASGPEAEG